MCGKVSQDHKAAACLFFWPDTFFIYLFCVGSVGGIQEEENTGVIDD